MKALHDNVEELRSEVSAKDAQISSLSSEVIQLKQELIGRETRISDLTAEADWLKKELAEKDELLATEKNVVTNSYFDMRC